MAAAAYRAFITGPNGVGMTDLGTLGLDSSLGQTNRVAINENVFILRTVVNIYCCALPNSPVDLLPLE